MRAIQKHKTTIKKVVLLYLIIPFLGGDANILSPRSRPKVKKERI
ncbi:hypothetical protein Javan533_0002 [Streptococcus phage Javan533]|nr:hypothetical protein Javan533_0002 [Streptococcus phage Javan533]QBX29739.1 hypothetical protein Javan510_0057 [Streptococcus phage Javan510]BAC63603.1 hypothetical protein [Streptococcus pyogenes SSI-1]BAU59958.1 hypothetical protein M3B_0588 [Streptococcus pyogenes]